MAADGSQFFISRSDMAACCGWEKTDYSEAMSIIVQPIEKGGSGRKFWRVCSGKDRFILVRYTAEREENRYFVPIADFLARVGVRVPKVDFHNEAEGIIFMEDAGEKDLWEYRMEPWPLRRMHYRRALDQVAILHLRAHLAEGCPKLQCPFDEGLYAWEQEYFIEHCLIRHFGMPRERVVSTVNLPRLAEIAATLASLPRCLVHRDFQSQNVIIQDGCACLIDFQGLRFGLGQYDVASLLLDPYVSLSEEEREEMLRYYFQITDTVSTAEQEQWRATYDLCAMQRLMQALGAYGKLGHLDGRAHFLAHIPPAVEKLRTVVQRIRGMDSLEKCLASLLSRGVIKTESERSSGEGPELGPAVV